MDIATPLELLHEMYNLCVELESEDNVVIKAGSPLAERIDMMISALNIGLLDRKVHPQQKLIDAGFYNHLIDSWLGGVSG